MRRQSRRSRLHWPQRHKPARPAAPQTWRVAAQTSSGQPDEAIQQALAEASVEHEAEKKRAVEEVRAELENEHTQALEALRVLHTAEVEQKISAASSRSLWS